MKDKEKKEEIIKNIENEIKENKDIIIDDEDEDEEQEIIPKERKEK
jgi:hypothetical protein